MESTQVIALASILLLGIGAMWISWRLNLPSILILLIFGFIAGPITNLLDPDLLFGDMLFPLISIAVAIILFEGGLNLKISDLGNTRGVVRNLITIGVLITWLIGSLGAYYILHLELVMALLLGAILVVTGPTVIIPLLRYLRPTAQLDAILKWEGVMNDPVGAMLAVLVFQAVLVGGFPEAPASVIISLLKTLLIAGSLSVAGAALIVVSFRRYWIPEYLHNAFTLMLVIAIFAISNYFQQDSGLFTATLMGIILANQKIVDVRHIVEFKENLRVLIISSLFIILAARLRITDMAGIGVNSLLFLGVLIFIARPAAVLLSTWRSRLSWQERTFISGLAPRGVVAAAVSSVFAIRLSELGYAQAEILVPITFVVILGTVAAYGLSAPLLSRWLKVAVPDPQGILIAGGSTWTRNMAAALHREGFKIMLVDNNWNNVLRSREAGIPTLYANILSEYAMDKLEMDGMGYLFAATSDDEFNSLVITQFSNAFERRRRFQVAPRDESNHAKHTVSRYLRGRVLFSPEMTGDVLNRALTEGGRIKVTRLTDVFNYDAFRAEENNQKVPMFVITEKDKLLVFSADSQPSPLPGQKIISLTVPPASVT